jgi:hypothetical protein
LLTPGLLTRLLTPGLLASLLALLTEALLILLPLLLAERTGRHRVAVHVDENRLPIRRAGLQDVFSHALDLLEASLAQGVLKLLLSLLAELLTLAELLRLAALPILLLAELPVLLLAELLPVAPIPLTGLAELLRLTTLPILLLAELLIALPILLTGLAGLLCHRGLRPVTILLIIRLGECDRCRSEHQSSRDCEN